MLKHVNYVMEGVHQMFVMFEFINFYIECKLLNVMDAPSVICMRKAAGLETFVHVSCEFVLLVQKI